MADRQPAPARDSCRAMRGDVKKQASFLTIVGPEQRVPQDHPIRRIKALADAELERLSPQFDEMYAGGGRARDITPHVAQSRDPRRKRHVVDDRVTRGRPYRASQRARKKVEESFGWMKTVGGFRKTRYRGAAKTGLWASITGAAYNLVRLSRLLEAQRAPSGIQSVNPSPRPSPPRGRGRQKS